MIGKTLSGYKILELVGSGGMGQVFRARDERLGRQVALKVLHRAKHSDERMRRLLLLEARAYSRVKHPAVVSIYTVGQDCGMDFIAMEWVPGQTLADHLAAGAMPIAQVVDIAVQLADALAAVHAAGIVHRDLKPQNVMVDERKVTLLDFGIAKVDGGLDVTTLSGSNTAQEGMAPGTIAYMAPEQALGEGVDRRSDVFAFGVLLYELLAGQRPFQGDTMPALVRQILFAAPKPLDRRRVPQGLQAVVLKTLAKRPGDRYPDMESLAQDLRQLGDAPSAAKEQPLGPPRLISKAALFHTRRSAAALLAGLAVLAGSLAFYGRQGAVEPNLSDAPAASLPKTSFALYEEGMQRLERFDREGYLDEAISYFEAAIAQSPDYAPAYLGLARAYWRNFRTKQDRGWLERAAQSALRARELDPLLTSTGILQARIQTAAGLLDEAKAALEKIREIDPRRAEALAGLAEIAQLEGNPAEAAGLYAKAIDLEPRNWELYSLLGGAQLATGDLEAAEAAFRQSLGLVPDNAIVRRNLGAVLHYQGRYGEAVTELQKSITIQPTARAYSNLGTAYFYQGSYLEAATAFEAARELGANHYLLWGNLGDAYRQIPGKGQDAIICFHRAIQLLKAKMAATRSDPTLESRLALYLVKAGRPAQGLAKIEQIEPLPKGTPETAAIAYRATLVHELAGQRQTALRALEIALEGGYPTVEILEDPELIQLREDVGFHELMVRFDTQAED